VLGKNNLLINREFGNMIQIGAVLVPVELEGDTIATYEGCLKDCNLCIESCPAEALNGRTVDQKLCRPHSNSRTEKGYILKKCNICRKICPNALGIESQNLKA
jgi:epoxyqueuosine reductase QueG